MPNSNWPWSVLPKHSGFIRRPEVSKQDTLNFVATRSPSKQKNLETLAIHRQTEGFCGQSDDLQNMLKDAE